MSKRIKITFRAYEGLRKAGKKWESLGEFETIPEAGATKFRPRFNRT